MNTPFFSVIVATYNRPEFVLEAAKSLISQTFKDFELLIINDGSSIDYSEVESYIQRYSQIRYFYKKNEERSAARNFGIKNANGKYICLLDDDDIFYNNHLEILFEEIKKKQSPIALFFTLHNLQKENGEIIPIQLNDPKTHPYGHFVSYLNCHSSTVCIHHKILEKHHYAEHISYWEDWDLWLSILKEFPQFPILHHTVLVRFHEGQTTKFSKRSSISKYFGIKWLYQKHHDIIPKKLYVKWKTKNLMSLAQVYLNESNYKRSLFFMKLSFLYQWRIVFSRLFVICFFKNLKKN